MKYKEFTMIAIEKGYQKFDVIVLKYPLINRIEYWNKGEKQILVEVLQNGCVMIYKEAKVKDL